MSSDSLRILIIDDLEDDALYIAQLLQRNLSGASYQWIVSADALAQALDQSLWDIILSDYTMPDFDVMDVLRIVRDHGLDLPVIVVSGAGGEEIAVSVMKAGAVDFIAKDKLLRLIPAIEREVRDARHRAARHRAEAELTLKTEALDASPVGILITDPNQPDNPIIYANRAFEEMTGYTIPEILGKNCRFLQREDRDQAALSEIRAALRDGRECHVTLRNYRKDGTMFWNSLQLAPIRGADGEIQHFVGTLSDVTALKTTENELRALYGATTILFQSNNLIELGRGIAETVVRQFKHADCGVMLLDEAQKKLIRLPRSGDYSITPTIELLVDGGGLVPTAVRTGRLVYAPDVTQHPDYEIGSARTRSELVIPLRTSRGMIGVMDLQSDQVDAFSERDQRILLAYAEHAAAALENVRLIEEINHHTAVLEWRVARRTDELERAKNQVEAILNNVGDVIVVLNAQGKILQANLAFERSFGYLRDQFEQQSFVDARLFADPEAIGSLIAEATATRSIQRGEFMCLQQHGGAFDVDVVMVPDDSEKVETEDLRIVCSIRDISAQKQMEASLRQSLSQAKELVELKARFVSMMSHEFRTPLAVILTSAQLLMFYSDKLGEEGRKEKLDNIQGQVKHLAQLSDGVLMLGQAETVGLPYQPHAMDGVAFCESVIEDLQILSPKRHSIKFAAIDCPSILKIDDRLLGHILRNLVSNAIKYSPHGGVIDVELRCEESHMLLTVKDQGIGIPEKAQQRMFEMFHRAENVGTIAGSGLGLSIVKSAVDICGGSITFSSIEGQGTTFVVLLPIDSIPVSAPQS